ncbi:GbsR/MarR family transcriptional regulator [Streptomyces flavofungini]|uniref:GbsR/MarR family transcriptional regulator n=1 Tax=Streptomyces flavofungini TaxID=68200 RepID=UPI0025AF8408|nr:MarR family transcriptional regulator [Streptomyces flavofungini]WJV50558.1 MarR family transcriptional regulator [Streptomyces flavofungini]
MPGGRLTHEDRRRIATGLTDGLGYAEIARRLGRPTSTVSREVARNGGPRGYRAEHAHHATARRARRTAPAPYDLPSADRAADADRRADPAAAHGRDPEAVRGFVDQFAELMVHTGLPRMAARVLASLVTADSGALTAADLTRRLRVSPASVSKAVAYLERLELLRRERHAVGRREAYVIDDDVWLRTWLTSARTHAMMADTAQAGVDILDPGTPAGARLDHMRQFFTSLSDDMAGGTAAEAFADALTVLAALVHAQVPLKVAQLADSLGWTEERVTTALHDAEQHPDIADPVAPRRTAPDTYAVVAREERLSAAQRAALTRR